ncbi:MAG: hypothetical protein A2Z69_01370 [Bacteroidetes bacterium RBG_13_44_24]|nr:MAG: hypothetical protein A2Z69_01370 [Bacteroidetes bacterium RBG_13_44_24]
MIHAEKFDNIITGIISGFLIPVIVLLLSFLFAKGDPGLSSWLNRIAQPDIFTRIISFCVFPNVLVFLLFNHLDMLKATRGVLAMTIAWAVLVFAVKFWP